MLQRYFLDIDRKTAEDKLLKQQSGFIIRRTSDETNEKGFLFIIETDEGLEFKNESTQKPLYYALTIKQYKNPRCQNYRIKSFERDPDKINAKLLIAMNELKIAGVIDFIDFDLTVSKNYVECISIHRDKDLRPEEILRARPILESTTGVLIISTQTPSQAAKSLQSGVQPGRSGLEMKKILSKSKLEERWVIITGHGDDKNANVKGNYLSLNFLTTASEPEVECKPEDYVKILLQGGLKKGDSINILLNVCYGGSIRKNSMSLADSLAFILGEKGINACIVASKTPVGRFDGLYKEHEEKESCLQFRVKGGPQNIIIISSHLDSSGSYSFVGRQCEENFNKPFLISTSGIGFLDTSKKKITPVQTELDSRKKEAERSFGLVI